jgi:uncharacterized protein (TIGR02588 family)
MDMPTSNHDKASAPLLEWAAAGAGLVLILLLLAVIGRAAISNERSNSPWIELRTGQTKTAASGFFLPIEVSNKAGRAVAALHIAGALRQGNRIVEESRATVDYVPGHGRASGGLFFEHDPERYKLSVRPIGYEDP